MNAIISEFTVSESKRAIICKSVYGNKKSCCHDRTLDSSSSNDSVNYSKTMLMKGGM